MRDEFSREWLNVVAHSVSRGLANYAELAGALPIPNLAGDRQVMLIRLIELGRGAIHLAAQAAGGIAAQAVAGERPARPPRGAGGLRADLPGHRPAPDPPRLPSRRRLRRDAGRRPQPRDPAADLRARRSPPGHRVDLPVRPARRFARGGGGGRAALPGRLRDARGPGEQQLPDDPEVPLCPPGPVRRRQGLRQARADRHPVQAAARAPTTRSSPRATGTTG